MLLPGFILVVSSCFNPHVCLMAEQWTRINSVDTFLYPYTLPLLSNPLYFLKSLPKCNLSSSLRSLQVYRQYSLSLSSQISSFCDTNSVWHSVCSQPHYSIWRQFGYYLLGIVICQVYLSGKYIFVVILPYQYLIYKPTFYSSHLSCNMPLQ